MLDQDRGLLYAEACFETVRVVAGRVFRWEAHMARLAGGLAAYGLPLPESAAEQWLDMVLKKAGAMARNGDALARVTASGGAAARGLLPAGERRVNVYVHAWPWHAPAPARLRPVEWPLPLADRPAKWTSDYGASIRALRGLRAAGQLAAGEEALVVDARGAAVSAPTANVAFLVDGRWVTPRLGPGVLPGVVRGALIEAGALAEEDCGAETAAHCEAAALLSSGAFIRPVAALDGRALARDAARFAPLWAALEGEPGAPAPVGRMM